MCCPWLSLGVPSGPHGSCPGGPIACQQGQHHSQTQGCHSRSETASQSHGPHWPLHRLFHTQLALQPVQPQSASTCPFKRLPQKATPCAAVGARSGPSRFSGPPGLPHCAALTPHMTGAERLRDRGSQDPPLTDLHLHSGALGLGVSAFSPSGSRLREVRPEVQTEWMGLASRQAGASRRKTRDFAMLPRT